MMHNQPPLVSFNDNVRMSLKRQRLGSWSCNSDTLGRNCAPYNPLYKWSRELNQKTCCIVVQIKFIPVLTV